MQTGTFSFRTKQFQKPHKNLLEKGQLYGIIHYTLTVILTGKQQEGAIALG